MSGSPWPAVPQKEVERVGDKTPVAAYVRMSTEHQRYSIENQLDALVRYAREHRMEIVRTYEDAGRSGLRLSNRKGLQQLLADVQAGTGKFSAILVLDVSRWGRFQDVDESAFYEFWCRRAGYAVHYCAEQFDNDGTPIAAIFKSIKRIMAAEYSRELSRKVIAGQRRIAQRGFKMGGKAGYGLRRLLVDADGNPKGLLADGDRKSIQSDHVILVPGPREEVDIINCIYSWFVEDSLGLAQIAEKLNSMQTNNYRDRIWKTHNINNILKEEKYIGNNIYGKTSRRLGSGTKFHKRRSWIIKQGAYEPVVDPKMYYAAQREFRRRAPRYTDSELLEKLSGLLKQHGYVTFKLIHSSPNMPNPETYVNRFGGLARAYAMIGYTGFRSMDNITLDRQVRFRQIRIKKELIDRFCEFGAVPIAGGLSKSVVFSNEYTVGIDVARRRSRSDRRANWLLHRDAINPNDIAVSVRLSPDNQGVMDYLLIPPMLFRERLLIVERWNGVSVDPFRFSSLAKILEIINRRGVESIEVHPCNQRVLEMAFARWLIAEKTAGRHPRAKLPRCVNSSTAKTKSIVRRYRTAVERMRAMVQNHELTDVRLDLVTAALKVLLANEHFRTLLRAEGFESMPQLLAERLAVKDKTSNG